MSFNSKMESLISQKSTLVVSPVLIIILGMCVERDIGYA